MDHKGPNYERIYIVVSIGLSRFSFSVGSERIPPMFELDRDTAAGKFDDDRGECLTSESRALASH